MAKVLKYDGESKKKIPNQCIIGDTCFTWLETIQGDLFTRHPKNLNHVNKYSNNLLSVIIILGPDVHVDETVFYDGEKSNDIGKIPMFWSIHVEDVRLAPLIKIYMNDIFVLVIDMFYIL